MTIWDFIEFAWSNGLNILTRKEEGSYAYYYLGIGGTLHLCLVSLRSFLLLLPHDLHIRCFPLEQGFVKMSTLSSTLGLLILRTTPSKVAPRVPYVCLGLGFRV